MSNCLLTHRLLHAKLLCHSISPGVCSNSSPLSQWCCLTISSSAAPFSAFNFSLASGSFPMSQLLPSGGQSIGASVSVSTSVLPIFKVDFLKDWLIWSPCSPRDSQDSSPAWQFESFNSSALSLLYSPALTSIPDYWKNHSFEHMELCQQSDVSAF